MLALSERLDTLGRMVLRAQLHFDLWCVTKRAESWEVHKVSFDEYWGYLRFNREAHEQNFIMQAGSILSKPRSDTITLIGTIDEVAEQGLISSSERIHLIKELRAHESARKGVLLLRHKLFAHRDTGWTYAEVWNRADVSLDALRALTESCLDVSNDLLEASGCARKSILQEPIKEFERLLLAVHPH